MPAYRAAHRRSARRAPGWLCIRPLRSGSVPIVLADRALCRRRGRRQRLRRRHPALHRRTERAGPRDAVHRRTTSRRRATAFALDKVEERSLSGDARLSRADLERNAATIENVPAVERSAAARYVRPDSGDPHLLRLRLGRQRPLQHQRQVPSDHAVGARAELAQPAEPHLDQRAADVHAWLRPDARPGQRGHARRAARPLHPRSAARLVGRLEGDAAGDLLRRAARKRMSSSRRRPKSSTIRAARTTCLPPIRARAACPSAACSGGCMFAIRFRSTDTFFSPTLTPESRVMMHRRISERVAQDRAVPDLRSAIRIWRSPTGGWYGFRTPTRPAIAIPTPAPPAA